MNVNMFVLVYRVFLGLYPRRFRNEFGGEMQDVFSQSVDEAAGGGGLSLVITLLREFCHLPGEALRQHLKLRTDTAGWQGPPSRYEILIALVIFAVPSTYVLLSTLPNLSAYVLQSLIGAVFLAFLFAGLLKGFPRWSLPYLGLVLSLVSFLFIFQWIADLIAPSLMSKLGPMPQDESTRLVLQAFWAGLLWLSLLVLTALVLGILALLRRFHVLLHCIRQDWTLVSYTLYYGATLTLFLAYDQYMGEQPFALASALCLGCGAWLYLHGSGRWQRILALVSGLSLAMLAAAAGRWPVPPAQDWRAWLLGLSLGSMRWSQPHWTIFDWVWMLLIILAPAAINAFQKKVRRPLAGP